jgi:hypothetical protein
MPVYRCNQCGFVSETASIPEGGKIGCGQCTKPTAVYPTKFFVEKLLERHFAALKEIEAFKAAEKPASPESSTDAENSDASALVALAPNLDLRNTSMLATPEQHAPLKSWFAQRQIDAKFDYALVDTTGFFDDAARSLGENYALFAELINRVRWSYRNSHSGLNLELASLSQKDGQAVNTLCRQFYSHTLFARYQYQKQEKIVRLTLQTAPTVKQFFEGGWLEWFALMELLEQLKARQRTFSCARGVKVVFQNEDLHEIDVMALVDGQTPIYIECKTGEFRRDIDKFLRLKKRLGLTRHQFIICASDLTDEQATGLSAMYELTFANLGTLEAKVQALL